MKRNIKKKYLLTPFILLVALNYLFAQAELTPVTKTFAIKNAHIIQQPGQVLELGTVVIKDGLIQAVGKNVSIPPNAKVLAADSMFVYAGFIDGISHTGIPKPEAKTGGSGNRRQKDAANPTYEKAGIQPQIQVRDVLNPKDKAISEMRKLGYTAAHVVPRGNMLPGGGSVILLNGKKADDFIYQDQASLFAQLKGAGGVFPATLIAVMSKFRELYTQAEQAKIYEQAYQRNPLGKPRPEQDRVLQAFYPTIANKQPVFFAAPAVKDMHRVFTLQKELGFPVVLTDVKQGWHLADKIKSTRTPVLLSLNLPKDKSKKAAKGKEGKKKKGEQKEAATKKEKAVKKAKKKPVSKELMAFQERQKTALKQYNSQATTFQEKGIPFGFTAISTKASEIRTNLRTMITHGLEEATALAALTTIPAKQLGVAQSMGTIEKGKLANLVITDKPYFEEKSNVRFVLVEGQVFKYDIKKKKKKGAAATAKIAGTWNYNIVTPDGAAAGVLTLKEEAGSFSGSITNEMADGAEDIQDVEVDGNELSFTVPIDDNGATAEITVNITEDAMEGTIVLPGMGTMDVEGERVPE